MEIPTSIKIQLLVIRYLSWVLPGLSGRWALHIFMRPLRVPRPASEVAWFESARKFNLQTGEKAFEWGNPHGPLVFLLHGWNGRGTQLGAFAEELAGRGYRVVAVDGPAHGESPGDSTNAGEFGRFLLKAQQELGVFKAIIAHSFGGGGSVLAIHWGLKVEKLVLIGTPSRYDVIVGNFAKIVGLSPRATKELFKAVGLRVGMAPEDMRIDTLGSRFDIPALIIHDRGDKDVPFAVAEKIQKAWPHAKLIATEGLGHRRILKDANVTKWAADFIDEK